MQHRQSLRMRFGNALVETHRGDLHQQRRLPVLIGQFEIVAHYRLHDKRPVQMIGPGDSAPKHQMVFLTTDRYRLR